MNECKKCPFCGSSKTRPVRVELRYERGFYYRVKCDKCMAYGPAAAFSGLVSKYQVEIRKNESINMWNERINNE